MFTDGVIDMPLFRKDSCSQEKKEKEKIGGMTCSKGLQVGFEPSALQKTHRLSTLDT